MVHLPVIILLDRLVAAQKPNYFLSRKCLILRARNLNVWKPKMSCLVSAKRTASCEQLSDVAMLRHDATYKADMDEVAKADPGARA